MRAGWSFKINDYGIQVITGDKRGQIVAPYSLKDEIIDINNQPLLVSHPGDRKLCHRIRKYICCLSVDFYSYFTMLKCPHFYKTRIKLWNNVMTHQRFQAKEAQILGCIEIRG